MYSDEKNIATAGCVEIHRSTVTERLKNDRNALRERLDQVEKALTALEAHPETQTILDLLAKIGHY
jgi:hypothetical protein